MPVLTTATAATVAGWTFVVSPYLWAPGISSSVDTRFGTLETDASIGDVVSSTNFALMGLVEARNGRWSLIADLVYTDLTERNDTPFGVLFSRARVDTRLTMASGYAGYRVYEDPRVAVDVLGGLRSVSMDIDVSLSPGALPGQSFGLSEDWVDPLVGGRIRVALDDHWFSTLIAEWGAFRATRTRPGRPLRSWDTSLTTAGRCRAAGASSRSTRRSRGGTRPSTWVARCPASLIASDGGIRSLSSWRARPPIRSAGRQPILTP